MRGFAYSKTTDTGRLQSKRGYPEKREKAERGKRIALVLLTFIWKYPKDYQPEEINEKQWEKEWDKQETRDFCTNPQNKTNFNQPSNQPKTTAKKNYSYSLNGILGFMHSLASNGEKEYVQQQLSSRTGIALLSNMQHPFRWPLTSYLQTQYIALRELRPHWAVNVRFTAAETFTSQTYICMTS